MSLWRNSERSLEWSRREVIGALCKIGTVKETSKGKKKYTSEKRQTDRQKYMRNRRKEKKILPIYKNTGD